MTKTDDSARNTQIKCRAHGATHLHCTCKHGSGHVSRVTGSRRILRLGLRLSLAWALPEASAFEALTALFRGTLRIQPHLWFDACDLRGKK